MRVDDREEKGASGGGKWAREAGRGLGERKGGQSGGLEPELEQVED